MASVQGQLGDLRQRTGVLEGNLQEVTASRDGALGDVRTLQAQLAETMAQLSAARAKAERLEAELRMTVKPARATRKAKPE